MSEIFLYTPDAKPTDYALRQLRANGYIPIKVAAFDQVRLLPKSMPVPEAEASMVAHAAFWTIAQYTAGPSQVFGKRLAELMATATNPARKDAEK